VKRFRVFVRHSSCHVLVLDSVWELLDGDYGIELLVALLKTLFVLLPTYLPSNLLVS
jgi:hypothetical protein